MGNTCPEGQIDGVPGAAEYWGMSEVTSATPRRSGRVFHKIRMQAQGKGHNGKKFREVCETVVVNAHGGLLLLKHEVDNGEMIVLTNPAPNIGMRPASADAGPFAGRSWVALFDDMGTAPDLSAIGLLSNPIALPGFDGNWLIRATGTNASGQPIVLGLPDKK